MEEKEVRYIYHQLHQILCHIDSIRGGVDCLEPDSEYKKLVLEMFDNCRKQYSLISELFNNIHLETCEFTIDKLVYMFLNDHKFYFNKTNTKVIYKNNSNENFKAITNKKTLNSVLSYFAKLLVGKEFYIELVETNIKTCILLQSNYITTSEFVTLFEKSNFIKVYSYILNNLQHNGSITIDRNLGVVYITLPKYKKENK